MIRIKGIEVHFGVEKINAIYLLPNTDMTEFQEKSCEPGTWMAIILYPSSEVSWATTKREISMNDFIEEDRIWLNVIYNQVFPCKYLTVVTVLWVRMMTCILSDITLNIGTILISN